MASKTEWLDIVERGASDETYRALFDHPDAGTIEDHLALDIARALGAWSARFERYVPLDVAEWFDPLPPLFLICQSLVLDHGSESQLELCMERNLANLKRIEFWMEQASFTSGFLSRLIDAPHLQRLEYLLFRGCIGDDHLGLLSSTNDLRSLRGLELSGASFTPTAMGTFWSSVLVCKLESLGLSSNQLTSLHLRGLLELEEPIHVRHLDLSGNDLTPADIEEIVRCQSLPDLEVLDVSENAITRAAARRLGAKAPFTVWCR